MDKIQINKIMEKLNKKGFSVWLEGDKLRYKAPKESVTAKNLQILKEYKVDIIQALLRKKENLSIVTDGVGKYEPFPLTDVQTAYLMGRKGLFQYGNVACHVYLELKYETLDVNRVKKIWNELIFKHDMLRTVIYEEGYQQVMETVPEFEIAYWDISENGNLQQYETFRKEMGNSKYEVGKWPMFGVAVAKKTNESILHFSMEFLIADWASIWMLLLEFEKAYYGNNYIISAPEVTFRDYLLAEKRIKESEKYNNDKLYWQNRISMLPESPDLPMLDLDKVQDSFSRKVLKLDIEKWNRFKTRAQKFGITPTVVILAVYSDVLKKWSANKSFCINLTVLNRLPLHEKVSEIIGDFTTLNILEINEDSDKNFINRAKKIGERLFDDLDHQLFSGVEVIRELSKNKNRRITMPIVYTSAIGLTDRNNSLIGEFFHGITQTPQVFIDCQAMDGNFGLQVNWDVRDGVFPSQMIDDMFSLFKERIEKLSEVNTDWEMIGSIKLPNWQVQERDYVNATDKDFPVHLLYTNFRKWVKKEPTRIAVIDNHKALSYGELDKYALKIKQELIRVGLKRNDCVSIIMGKSVYQVAAVLGVLYAGCIYVPIMADQATGRAEKIIEITESKVILTTSNDKNEYMNKITTIEVDRLTAIEQEDAPLDNDVDDIAYIIFTSGSTGDPKGVKITHRAAINTIKDINDKFKVNKDDTVLGISRLNFDLSVYDIFGLLGVGGKIVYPSDKQYMNPEHWIELITKYNITIWNSVPALMKILLAHLEVDKSSPNINLKNVLLSGDWISYNMPKKIKKYASKAEIICLGGATEASIWSIYHIYNENEVYKKIPYGKPLSNQKMDVVDSDYESCPVYVPGEIVIKGEGLASGYYKDDMLTNEKFIVDNVNNEVFYLTGDIGRYLPGGEIEFIGRNDNQVKIRGNRIELAEIENTLNKLINIKDAIAVVDHEKNEIFSMIEPEIVSPDIVKERKDDCYELYRYLEKHGEEYFKEFDWGKAYKCINEKNIASVYSLLFSLQKIGLFKKNEKVYIDDIMSNTSILPKYSWLIKPWINVLEEYGLIKKFEDEGFIANENITEKIVEEKWNNAFEGWYEKLGDKSILQYIKDNTDEFINIISGKVDPISLLYPDGSNKYTNSLYFENVLTKYINKSICEIIKKYEKRNNDRVIKILEVGAGTGATTEWVLKTLEGSRFQYFFTDISKYFFPNANKKFGKYNNFQIKKLDLNEDFFQQGFMPNSFDIVIGAYVLNNVKNIKSTIKKLEKLIKPGGYLLFSETIKEEPWLLVSQALMMTQPEDNLRKDRAFISPSNWSELLDEINPNNKSLVIPKQGNQLSILGGNLFFKEIKTLKSTINMDKLYEYLKTYLPSYMIPSQICVTDEIPLSLNGKIDRNAILNWFRNYRNKEENAKEKEESTTDLEKKIGEIWSEALDVEFLGKKENFYDYGADSLIMAQVATKIRNNLQVKVPFDALLRELLNSPTIESISKYIEGYDRKIVDDTQVYKSFEKIKKYGQKKDERGRIIIHGALGSTEIYKNLIYELENQNYGEILSIEIADMNKYFDIESEDIALCLADIYSKRILEQNYKKVQIIGYSFSGVIAIEIAKRLLEKGLEVEDVSIIDGGSIPIEVLDEIIYEMFFVSNIHTSLEKIGFEDSTVFERVFENIILNKKHNISISDFKNDNKGDNNAFELLNELSLLPQETRFQKYINFSEDLNVKNSNVEVIKRLYKIFKKSFDALHFVPTVYFGDIRYFKTKERIGIFKYFELLQQEWKEVCIGDFNIKEVDGNHYTCLENKSNASKLASEIGNVYKG